MNGGVLAEAQQGHERKKTGSCWQVFQHLKRLQSKGGGGALGGSCPVEERSLKLSVEALGKVNLGAEGPWFEVSGRFLC